MNWPTCSTVRCGAVSIGFLGLLGCNQTTLRSIARPDPANPDHYIEVPADQTSGLVAVYRGGQVLVAQLPFPLSPGDEIETRRDASVVAGFPGNGYVILKPPARVRLGSLEVVFGRVFAKVRGIFSTWGHNVEAASEGTQFLFEVDPRGQVRVAVLEGVVVCRSKTESWPAVRLGAGQTLIAPFSDLPPTVQPANLAELNELQASAVGIEQLDKSVLALFPDIRRARAWLGFRTGSGLTVGACDLVTFAYGFAFRAAYEWPVNRLLLAADLQLSWDRFGSARYATNRGIDHSTVLGVLGGGRVGYSWGPVTPWVGARLGLARFTRSGNICYRADCSRNNLGMELSYGADFDIANYRLGLFAAYAVDFTKDVSVKPGDSIKWLSFGLSGSLGL